MLSITDIKRRIKSVTETKHITKAMELISIAKMKKALQRYDSNHIYFEKVRYTLRDIFNHSAGISHHYLEQTEGHQPLYIVIAGDKGLAGGYNINLLNEAKAHMKNFQNYSIITIGQVAREFFEREGREIDISFTHVLQNPTLKNAREITADIITLYNTNVINEVYVVFTKLVSTAKQTPEVFKLLPLDANTIGQDLKMSDNYQGELKYYPSPKAVLDILIPQYIVGMVYGFLVQSVASEHSSRMQAMASSNKNADEMLGNLMLQYNRARQEKVTNEVIELVSSRVDDSSL